MRGHNQTRVPPSKDHARAALKMASLALQRRLNAQMVREKISSPTNADVPAYHPLLFSLL